MYMNYFPALNEQNLTEPLGIQKNVAFGPRVDSFSRGIYKSLWYKLYENET